MKIRGIFRRNKVNIKVWMIVQCFIPILLLL